MRSAMRLGLVAMLLFGCVGCDQASKHLIRSHVELGHTESFFGDTLRLTHAENPGAFLGLGASLPSSVRVLVFQGAVALVVLGLLLAAILQARLGTPKVVGLTLIAAGGAGNLIDRLLRDGLVTDFLNVGIGPLRTGIFNVADIAGMVGVAMVLLARDGVVKRVP